SAPARSCSRTARRRSSAPSACRPSSRQPWPPVMQTARPAQRTRGPGITPARTASRTASSAYSRPPRSRTVVTPASTVRRARTTALTTVAAYVSSGSVRDVARLVPADVGDPVEHIVQELAQGLATDHAGAPRVLAERGLEDDVIRHHRQDAVDVVRVPHAIEAVHESVTVECHGSPPVTAPCRRARRRSRP